MDLFEYMRQQNMKDESPLASRLRPTTLDEVVGQQHIVGKDKLLYRAIKADKLSSIIFYGPPGTGKTTLAKVIANTTSAEFMQINATSAGKKDMEEVVAAAKNNQGMYGKKTILFIDEINCVSETLAPTMLQFLQNKTFGSHSVPEGWLIAAAGNPPEYNKSVREFDIVTLDRVRRMDIEADLEVWMEYAWKKEIHGSILAYLGMKKDHFYSVENTVDGKFFVTARGWEDLSEILKALLDSIWAILFPVLLIVLIRFGIMSPTESGSFACAYALLVGTVFYHELTWESLLQTLRDSVKDITVITIILAFSGVFGYGIVFDNITVTIANALLGITSNSAILLLLVVVFLLICGMFMETTVIALILTPILLPVMRSIGVNEVVFGMIMMTTVTFGVMTPPVGTALYAVSDIMECPIEETFKKGWPFYLAIVGVILFMIFFPQAVLFLPNLVYGA